MISSFISRLIKRQEEHWGSQGRNHQSQGSFLLLPSLCFETSKVSLSAPSLREVPDGWEHRGDTSSGYAMLVFCFSKRKFHKMRPEHSTFGATNSSTTGYTQQGSGGVEVNRKYKELQKYRVGRWKKIINSAFNFSPPISYKCDLI